ncbi:MAG: hypothetical protein JNL83_36335 [Myxococcales bacterium]|nr:hypothetical protein [Myxococcales bacterium]
MLITELDLALDVGKHLDAVGATWCIGGSVASSILGVPRATLDVDLVADLRQPQVAPLCAALAAEYYVDEDTCRWAVDTRRSFNAIHLETMIKIDVFCAKDDELSRNELSRRIVLTVGDRSVPVCTPEDIILQKLMWYVESGGSERQWGDALGVVRTRRAQLDLEYLTAHAAANGLGELLARLLATS